MSGYLLRVRNRGISLARPTLAEISQAFAEARDESGEGANTWPDGTVFERGPYGRAIPLGRVSYNGRIWSSEPGAPPIYDPIT